MKAETGLLLKKLFLATTLALIIAGVASIATGIIAVAQGDKVDAIAGKGLALMGAGLAVGLAGVGGGYAIGRAGAAMMAAMVERPELFGRMFIVIVLAEGIALYGLLVAILLWIVA